MASEGVGTSTHLAAEVGRCERVNVNEIYLVMILSFYAKVKEAGKTLMSAQSSSFKVRWRGAPAGARRRSGLHGGL